MTRYNKSLAALLIGAMTLVGGAGLAQAYGHGGPHHGGDAREISPELRQMMEKAYNHIAPLQMELRAKQTELTAKIYGGADDKTIQALSAEVNALQNKVTEARVAMQKEFAKAGVPLHGGFHGMRGGMGNCPMMLGMGGHGFHGGMMGGCGAAIPPAAE